MFDSDFKPEAFELEKSESGVYEEELLELDWLELSVTEFCSEDDSSLSSSLMIADLN